MSLLNGEPPPADEWTAPVNEPDPECPWVAFGILEADWWRGLAVAYEHTVAHLRAAIGEAVSLCDVERPHAEIAAVLDSSLESF